MKSPLEVVGSAYDAWERHDVVDALCALSPAVRIHREDGLPYAGDYVGREAVAGMVRDVLCDWDWLEAQPVRYTAHERLVAVHGTYHAAGKVTGFVFEDEFVHLWDVQDGLGVRVGLYRTVGPALRDLDRFLQVRTLHGS